MSEAKQKDMPDAPVVFRPADTKGHPKLELHLIM
jgi:hypothetical protein